VSVQLLVILFALATFSIFQRNARLTREDKAASALKASRS
jgi:high-affinity iron transporter